MMEINWALLIGHNVTFHMHYMETTGLVTAVYTDSKNVMNAIIVLDNGHKINSTHIHCYMENT